MLAENMEFQIISKITELTKEKIEKIRDDKKD